MVNQRKLANLGALVRCLELATPDLLQKTMPSHLVHPNISFEVFPETYELKVGGSRAYKTLQKIIQMSVCPWLIPRGSKLAIISSKLTDNAEIEDRRLWIHWRSVLPDQTGIFIDPKQKYMLSQNFDTKFIEPGKFLSNLGLLPNEYPVLAGSFEFGFDSECQSILLHILRNVEYMWKPDSQLIMFEGFGTSN